MKDIPVDTSDFISIRERSLYYVDKTQLIDTMMKQSSIFLFTRPPGFGKSVNLSMLDAYFNIDYKGNHWFDDLKISELRPDDPEKNRYPVIRLNLGGLRTDSLESFHDDLAGRMSELYLRYPYLENFERYTREYRTP